MATLKVTVSQDIEVDDADWAEYGADPDWLFGIFRDRLYAEETKWKIEQVEEVTQP